MIRTLELWLYPTVEEVGTEKLASHYNCTMKLENHNSESRNVIESLRSQFSEDPNREPHEKETGLHVEGDSDHFTITSFKKVVYTKLLRQSEFSVKRLHAIDDGWERTVESLDDAADPSLVIIGVTGQLPVGSVNIGTPRKSNSHADVVK